MKKLVTFYSFTISSFMAISGILSAKNIFELSTAIVFSLVSYYFFILMLPKKARPVVKIEPVLDIIPDKIKEIKNPDYDPQRRKFLKLVGAAGGSLFLMALLTRKAEASFFGSMPGPGTVAIKNTQGVAIDPAEKKPTDGYTVSEIDDSGSDIYYGFLNKDGAWYIQKETSDGGYRYVKGSSGFSTYWSLRDTLTYNYFNEVF